MTKDKVPDKLKKLVIDSLRRHAWNMDVSEFTGDIFWKSENKDNDDLECLAEIKVNFPYMRYTLSIYPCFIERWEDRGDGVIEETMAHEVAHLATQHMYDCAVYRHLELSELRDAWERLTERISRLSVKLDAYNRKIKSL